LPLALLSIGASLHFHALRKQRGVVALVVVGKLVVMPLFTLLLVQWWYPEASTNAVASYVVACQARVEEGLVSAILIISTVISVITIPLWLYLVV